MSRFVYGFLGWIVDKRLESIEIFERIEKET